MLLSTCKSIRAALDYLNKKNKNIPLRVDCSDKDIYNYIRYISKDRKNGVDKS